jgi:hypothetical protein
MTQTMTQLYATHATAMDVVAALKNAGFNDEHMSLVGRQDPVAETETTGAAEGAATGSGIGGGLGVGAGLMAGLGMLAIPGIGPVVAAGWLASTAAVGVAGAVAGAATGGIIGALTGNGATDDDAHVYAEGIRRGGTLVTVRVADERSDEARRILANFPALSSSVLREEYNRTGWRQFDVSGAPYVPGTVGTIPGPVDSRTVPR